MSVCISSVMKISATMTNSSRHVSSGYKDVLHLGCDWSQLQVCVTAVPYTLGLTQSQRKLQMKLLWISQRSAGPENPETPNQSI